MRFISHSEASLLGSIDQTGPNLSLRGIASYKLVFYKFGDGQYRKSLQRKANTYETLQINSHVLKSAEIQVFIGFLEVENVTLPT